MSYFAVRCRPGLELQTLEMIKGQLDKHDFTEEILSIVCPAAVVYKDIGMRMVSLSFSYLYLQTKSYMVLPAKIYQFLSSLPYVSQILNNEIDEQEVIEYCNLCGVSMNESMVEIKVRKQRISYREHLLIQINSKDVEPEQKKQIEDVLKLPMDQYSACKAIVGILDELDVDESEISFKDSAQHYTLKLNISLVEKVFSFKNKPFDLYDSEKIRNYVYSETFLHDLYDVLKEHYILKKRSSLETSSSTVGQC